MRNMKEKKILELVSEYRKNQEEIVKPLKDCGLDSQLIRIVEEVVQKKFLDGVVELLAADKKEYQARALMFKVAMKSLLAAGFKRGEAVRLLAAEAGTSDGMTLADNDDTEDDCEDEGPPTFKIGK
jgi:hypothetical protein